MELEEKVDNLTLKVERNSSDIHYLKEAVADHEEKIENFMKFATATRAEQEARDKSLNRLLGIVTIISALSPVMSAYLTSLIR